MSDPVVNSSKGVARWVGKPINRWGPLVWGRTAGHCWYVKLGRWQVTLTRWR